MTSKMTIERGNRVWRNAEGQRHRDGDLPAIIGADGSQTWYQKGQRHRVGDLPAYIGADGSQTWYQRGQLVDSYYPNFGCFVPKSRAEALARLDAKKRPFSRALYLADIDRLWPK